MEKKELISPLTRNELKKISQFIEQINNEDKNELLKIVQDMEKGSISSQQFEKIEALIETELSLHKAQVVNLSDPIKERRSPFLERKELLNIKNFLQQEIYPKIIKNMVEQSLEIEKKFENDFVILFSRWGLKSAYMYYKDTKEVKVFQSIGYGEKFGIIVATSLDDNQWDFIFNEKWEKLFSEDKKYRVLSNPEWATEKGFLKVIEIGIWNILLKFPEQIQVTPEWEGYDSFEFWYYDEIWILWFRREKDETNIVTLFNQNGTKIGKEMNKRTFFDEYTKWIGLTIMLGISKKLFQLLNPESYHAGARVNNFDAILNISFQTPEWTQKVLKYMREKFWI